MSIYFHIPLTEVYEVNSLKLGTKKALSICINGTSISSFNNVNWITHYVFKFQG